MKKILFFFIFFPFFLFANQCLEFKANFELKEDKIIDFATDENYIYLLKTKSLLVLELLEEKEIVEISKEDLNYEPLKIFNSSNYLFIVDSTRKIHIYNTLEGKNIYKISQFEVEEIPKNILFKNDFIYILFEKSLKIFKVNENFSINLFNFLNFTSEIKKAEMKENLIFMGLESNEIVAVDVEDNEYPFVSSKINLENQIIDFAISDSFIYIIYLNGYDVFSLMSDNFLNKVYEEKGLENIKGAEIVGNYLLIFTNNNEMAVFEINDIKNPEKIFNYLFDNKFNAFKIKGNFVFLNEENKLEIFDIKNCCKSKPESFSIFKPIQKRNYYNEINVIFDWSDSSFSLLYDLYLDKKNPPEQIFLKDIQISKAEILIKEEGNYYFQIKAKNGCGEILSNVMSFNLSPPGPFELLYPDDGAANLPTEITFDWSDSVGAEYYELYLGTQVPPPLYESYILESEKFIFGLQNNTKYYWYVKAINQEGSSTTRKRAFETGGPDLKVEDKIIVDYCAYGGWGNGNKLIEPGEEIGLLIGIKNTGIATASNVYGIIEALTPEIIILNDFSSYPDIPNDGQLYYNYDFFIFSIPDYFECMSTIELKLTIYSNSYSKIENLIFNVGERNFKMISENFENWVPQNWQIRNNGGNCIWESTETTGLPNYTGGNGNAADADSDWCGEGTIMDTELWTPYFNLPYASTSTICLPYGSPPVYATAATLEFKTSYRDSGTPIDNFKVEISSDGGSFWQEILFWDEDHSPLGPGEFVSVDLTPFAGLTNLIIRFAYKAFDWLWWAEVDEVEINVPYGCQKCGPSPGNFYLIYPQNGQTGLPFNLTLQWEASSNATCYNLYFGTTNPPPLYSSFIPTNEINISGLLPYTWYFWKVEAVNGFGLKNSEGGIYSFRTKSLNQPMEVPDGSLIASKEGNMIKLSWDETCGSADDYTIYEGDLNLLKEGIYNHYSILCSDTNQDLQESFYSNLENAYYLVVPRNGDGVEGSYGKDIPQGNDIANCGITGFEPIECPTNVSGNFIYYGYHQQTNNGDWEGFINSPASFKIENGYLTEIDPLDRGIVYITPSNYVILLSYNHILEEPVLLIPGRSYELNYHIEYTNSSGNVVLTSDYHYVIHYETNYLYGYMDMNVVALDPMYNDFQGHFYFNFEAGLFGNGNGSGKFLGANIQTNNGDWEGYINSPLNITLDNLNLNVWDEDDRGIVYITPSNYVILLGYSQIFDPPIPVSNGEPFNISYTIEYTDDLGRVVLTGDYVIDGTFNSNYLNGFMNATMKALDPAYKDYQGKFYWSFDGGIQDITIAKLKNKKERYFKILGNISKEEELKLKGGLKGIKIKK